MLICKLYMYIYIYMLCADGPFPPPYHLPTTREFFLATSHITIILLSYMNILYFRFHCLSVLLCFDIISTRYCLDLFFITGKTMEHTPHSFFISFSMCFIFHKHSGVRIRKYKNNIWQKENLSAFFCFCIYKESVFRLFFSSFSFFDYSLYLPPPPTPTPQQPTPKARQRARLSSRTLSAS
jgi:hypothetical protein